MKTAAISFVAIAIVTVIWIGWDRAATLDLSRTLSHSPNILAKIEGPVTNATQNLASQRDSLEIATAKMLPVIREMMRIAPDTFALSWNIESAAGSAANEESTTVERAAHEIE